MINKVLQTFDMMFPDAECELVHNNEFELLISVMLSAQSTDASVNKLTNNLFKKYKTPQNYVDADIKELEQDLKEIGLYRNKAKNIKATCESLIYDFNGQVPKLMEELVSLPGVGRKTASVVQAVAFDIPAIPVDTHVDRVSKRLGMANDKDSVIQVEKKLSKLLPKSKWNKAHHQFIHFGRYHCTARNPKCNDCPLTEYCKYYSTK